LERDGLPHGSILTAPGSTDAEPDTMRADLLINPDRMGTLSSTIGTLLAPSRAFSAARCDVSRLVREWATKAGPPTPTNATRYAARWARNAPDLLREGRRFPELILSTGTYLLDNAVNLLLDQVMETANKTREPLRSALLAVVHSGGADLLADLVRVRILKLDTKTVHACEAALRAGRFPLPRSLWVDAEVELL